MVRFFGVVDKEACLLVIGLQEVISSDLKRLGNPFANGDAGHHDDELAPAILLVELKHRLDVAVGLARPCFHLDVEIKLGYLGFDQCI
ncbi:hypothetical protein D3C84_699450 [compost metagenome]